MDDPANAMVLVRTTVGMEEHARKLARRLIDDQVACCVHLQRIDSVYVWEGKTEEGGEWMVEARTPKEKQDELFAAMLNGHPFDTPLVELIGETLVNGKYAKWAKEMTGISVE